MKIPKSKTQHKIENKLERFVYNSRWFLVPLYITLLLLEILIMIKFFGELIHFIQIMGTLTENEWIIHILKLIDLTLIGNLVIIIGISGYENFVSKLDIAKNDVDRPSWIDRLDFSGIKLVIISSVVAISLIELLQDFLNATAINPEIEFWRIVLHLVFVITGIVFAAMEMIKAKKHEITESSDNKEVLYEIKGPID